uniref:Uncharacterized protein n=1 Tax=Sphaerodactylus townsendi TaxID=933632 RepID=A0ACB8EEM4_9SAUR
MPAAVREYSTINLPLDRPQRTRLSSKEESGETEQVPWHPSHRQAHLTHMTSGVADGRRWKIQHSMTESCQQHEAAHFLSRKTPTKGPADSESSQTLTKEWLSDDEPVPLGTSSNRNWSQLTATCLKHKKPTM